MFRRVQLTISTIVAQALVAGSLHAQAPVEKVHLVITGGPSAGTYDATTDRAGCSANATGPGSFGNQLSSTKGDVKTFNSLQLIVPSAKAAASGTSEFQVIARFGTLMQNGAQYEVNTLAATKTKTGSGTVKVQDSGGDKASVEINAVTAKGVKLVGTITCYKVTRL